jgi:hypothetical protein
LVEEAGHHNGGFDGGGFGQVAEEEVELESGGGGARAHEDGGDFPLVDGQLVVDGAVGIEGVAFAGIFGFRGGRSRRRGSGSGRGGSLDFGDGGEALFVFEDGVEDLRGMKRTLSLAVWVGLSTPTTVQISGWMSGSWVPLGKPWVAWKVLPMVRPVRLAVSEPMTASNLRASKGRPLANV